MNTYFGRTLQGNYDEVVRRLEALPQYHPSRLRKCDPHNIAAHVLCRLVEWHQDVTTGQQPTSLDNIREDFMKEEVFKSIIDMLKATQELFDYFEKLSPGKTDKLV